MPQLETMDSPDSSIPSPQPFRSQVQSKETCLLAGPSPLFSPQAYPQLPWPWTVITASGAHPILHPSLHLFQSCPSGQHIFYHSSLKNLSCMEDKIHVPWCGPRMLTLSDPKVTLIDCPIDK